MTTDYQLTPPKAAVSEVWLFRSHPRAGPLLRGEVMHVETHYERGGLAYHLYHMQVTGYSRGAAGALQPVHGAPPGYWGVHRGYLDSDNDAPSRATGAALQAWRYAAATGATVGME